MKRFTGGESFEWYGVPVSGSRVSDRVRYRVPSVYRCVFGPLVGRLPVFLFPSLPLCPRLLTQTLSDTDGRPLPGVSRVPSRNGAPRRTGRSGRQDRSKRDCVEMKTQNEGLRLLKYLILSVKEVSGVFDPSG